LQPRALREPLGLAHEGVPRGDDGLFARGAGHHRAPSPGEHQRDGLVERHELRFPTRRRRRVRGDHRVGPGGHVQQRQLANAGFTHVRHAPRGDTPRTGQPLEPGRVAQQHHAVVVHRARGRRDGHHRPDARGIPDRHEQGSLGHGVLIL
jgi:hypothetical protein